MIDRTLAPLTSLPTSLTLPTEQIFENAGVKLYALYAAGANVVRLSLVFKGGSSVQSVPYSASSMLSMLSEGSENMTAAQVAEQLDFFGIFYDSSTDRDFCTITVASLTKFLPKTLEILEQILLHPTFDDKELATHKAKKQQGLIADRQKPSYIAREAFSRELFGTNHPYGRFYPTDDVMKLKSDDLRQYHSRFIVAERMFAVCSGDVGAVQIELINDFLTKIRRSNEYEPEIAIGEPISNIGTTIVEREGESDVVQSCIRMGRVIFNKNHPDYIPMQLLLTVLGGYFSSRLMLNLREDKGYTYGIYSSMVSLSKLGYMAISTDVALSAQSDAITQINQEIELLKSTLIGVDELQMAKNTITGELMRLLDGPFGIADIAIENISNDLPSDYINVFLEKIAKATPEQLQNLARQHLTDFTTVIIH